MYQGLVDCLTERNNERPEARESERERERARESREARSLGK